MDRRPRLSLANNTNDGRIVPEGQFLRVDNATGYRATTHAGIDSAPQPVDPCHRVHTGGEPREPLPTTD